MPYAVAADEQEITLAEPVTLNGAASDDPDKVNKGLCFVRRQFMTTAKNREKEHSSSAIRAVF